MLHGAEFQVSPWANPRLNELQDFFSALWSTALKEKDVWSCSPLSSLQVFWSRSF